MPTLRGHAAVWALALAFASLLSGAPARAQVEVILGGASPTPAPSSTKAVHPKHKAAAPQHRRAAVRQGPSRMSLAIVGYALHFLGTPYVWGGASPSGFDCSGYTWYVYRMLGFAIPRTADVQFAEGYPVADPMPGDLVFFQTYDYGASHVGIYIGGGRFVSAIAGSVQIGSFGSTYFGSRYIGARRFAPLG